jgi:hypothetical protein
VHRRHQAPQEIRGSAVEGPAVSYDPATALNESAALTFVTPSGAEGSAVFLLLILIYMRKTGRRPISGKTLSW